MITSPESNWSTRWGKHKSTWTVLGTKEPSTRLQSPPSLHPFSLLEVLQNFQNVWSNRSWLVELLLLLSHFSCVRLCANLWTAARQVPLSMGFFREKYWCGLPFPSPGDLPNSGIKPGSLMSYLHWQAGSLPLSFPGGAVVNNLPANAGKTQERLIQSMGWEDPLKEGMATHSSILAWKIPWTEEPAGYGPRDSKESIMTEHAQAMESICTTPSKKKKQEEKKKSNASENSLIYKKDLPWWLRW